MRHGYSGRWPEQEPLKGATFWRCESGGVRLALPSKSWREQSPSTPLVPPQHAEPVMDLVPRLPSRAAAWGTVDRYGDVRPLRAPTDRLPFLGLHDWWCTWRVPWRCICLSAATKGAGSPGGRNRITSRLVWVMKASAVPCLECHRSCHSRYFSVVLVSTVTMERRMVSCRCWGHVDTGEHALSTKPSTVSI